MKHLNVVISDNVLYKRSLNQINLLYEYLIGIRLNNRPGFMTTKSINVPVLLTHLKYTTASKVYSQSLRPSELALEYYKGPPLAVKIRSMCFPDTVLFFKNFTAFFQKNFFFRHNDIHWYNVLVKDPSDFIVIDFACSDIIGILHYDFKNKKDDVTSTIAMFIDCLQAISTKNQHEKAKLIILKKKLYALYTQKKKKTFEDLSGILLET